MCNIEDNKFCQMYNTYHLTDQLNYYKKLRIILIYYSCIIIMLTFILFLLLLLLQVDIIDSQTLCSAACTPNSCSGRASNQCLGCTAPFVLSESQCLIPAGTGYTFVASQGDFTSNVTTTDTCGAYTFVGPLAYNSQVRLTYPGPITTNHFKVNFIVWVFMFEGWSLSGTDKVMIDLLGSGTVTLIVDSSKVSNQIDLCGTTLKQYYMKVHGIYPHFDTTSSLQFVVSVTNIYSQKWGIKDYMFFVENCHIACKQCTSALNTTCSVCETNYKLSGQICHTTCLTQYGQTTNPLVCVLCNGLCTKCYQTSVNCSRCVTQGANQAFLYGNTCIQICPNYYAEQKSTHTCQRCRNSNCLDCDTNNRYICLECDYDSYWLTNNCYEPCPSHYFIDGRNCTACTLPCSQCQGISTTCTYCSSPNYLLNSACVTCPTTHFPYQPTRVCLDCSIYCVTATMNVYFSADDVIEAEVCFTQPLNFTSFSYQTAQQINWDDTEIKASKLIISYQISSDRCYKIKVAINRFLRLQNVLVSFIMNSAPTVDQYSLNYYKLSPQVYTLNESILWNYVKLPGPSDADQALMAPFRQLNDNMNTALSQIGVQQFKKAGIFAMLCPGSQLSSTTILHNAPPPENMYQAMRFWGTFVYFEVPRWEQNSQNTKYIVNDPVSDIISSSRLLQTTQENPISTWRFERTGHTTYFVLDVYVSIILLVSSWIALIIVHCFKNKLQLRYRSIIYSFIHKLHEVMIFYLILSTIIQWLTFSSQSNLKHVSLAFSIIMIIYVLLYEVYIFYRLIPYGAIEVGSQQFCNFVEKFSYFLKDIRHQNYDPRIKQWSLGQLLRPYNYQMLSFYRLIMFVAAIPLFQEYTHGTITCLMIIQILQILRFLLTWPYYSLWRNIYKLSLQLCLLLIFCLFLGQSVNRIQIHVNINITEIQEVDNYYRIGWTGFAFFFIYNIAFIVYFLIDIVIGCEYTNWERMQFGRKLYYQETFVRYRDYGVIATLQGQSNFAMDCLDKLHGVKKQQQYQSQTKQPKKLLSSLAIKGNLLQINYTKLKKITLKIQQYKIKSIPQSLSQFQIRYQKAKDLFLKLQPNSSARNNVLIPHRKQNKITLGEQSNSAFYIMMKLVYEKYKSLSTEYVVIQTYIKIDQQLYSPGQKISMKTEDMSQQILVYSFHQDIKKHKLDKLIEGFPISYEQIDKL